MFLYLIHALVSTTCIQFIFKDNPGAIYEYSLSEEGAFNIDELSAPLG